MRYLLLCISFLPLMLIGCKQNDKSRQNLSFSTEVEKDKFNVMSPPEIPVMLTETSSRMEYFILHFWDNSMVGDTTFLKHQEDTEQAWANYIGGLTHVPFSVATEAIRHLFSRTDWHKGVYKQFVGLAEKYFYDPNSPYRNEEFYIPVLESMLSSAVLSDAEKIVPQERLDMAMKNRLHTQATDFTYTLFSGKQGRLYAISSDFVLLFINNPGCEACTNSIRFINESSSIQAFISEKRLTVLSFYPDEDLALWKRHYPEYPDNWIVGYDKNLTVLEKGLYDLKAIPTFYLLDKHKKVLIKDGTLQQIEQFLRGQSITNK